MATVQISSDAFARTTFHRDVVRNPGQTCSWCSGLRKNGSLFRYYSESPSGKRSEPRGLFCCKSCHDSYHS